VTMTRKIEQQTPASHLAPEGKKNIKLVTSLVNLIYTTLQGGL